MFILILSNFLKIVLIGMRWDVLLHKWCLKDLVGQNVVTFHASIGVEVKH